MQKVVDFSLEEAVSSSTDLGPQIALDGQVSALYGSSLPSVSVCERYV